MKTRCFKLGRLRLAIADFTSPAFGTAHGPRRLPWWKPVVVKAVPTNPDLPHRNPLSWNVWIYSRWGTVCNHVAIAPKGR